MSTCGWPPPLAPDGPEIDRNTDPETWMRAVYSSTGYNTAILAHRLGAEDVASIEIDSEIAQQARTNLATAGHHVHVITGDGAAGYRPSFDIAAGSEGMAAMSSRVYGWRGAATVSHLRAILPLLGAHVDPAVRGRLHAAATHLALQAGWMSFDTESHDMARRIWLVGLEIAQGADDPLTTDLTVHLLFMMARQALHLSRADEALQLVRVGQAAAEGTHRVSPSTGTTLMTNLACAHAARGDTRGCERALGEAEEEFTEIDPATAAPWACVDGPVKLITWQGHAYYELGRARRDQGCLQQALGKLVVVTANPHAMSRAMYLPDLAGCHALTGDIGTAVAVGHQAVDLANTMHSRRAQTRLAQQCLINQETMWISAAGVSDAALG